MNRANPILRSALVLAPIICALALFDRFLARTEAEEVRREAHHNFVAGSALLEQGKGAEAVESLRTAHVLVRQNTGYEMRLGAALLAAGKLDEAQRAIESTLQREPNDGTANLIAARLMVAKSMPREAGAFYHRAIYGNWPADKSMSAVAARMELVDYLIKRGKKGEAIPELISLSEESPDPALQKKLASDFRWAGAPSRAAAIYRELIARSPADVEGYIGLGEAELEQGDYRGARNAFVKALARGRHAQVIPRLGLVNTVVALDPTPRQLTSLEKYRRSVQLLTMVRDEVIQAPAPSPEVTPLLQQADQLIARKAPPHVTNELAEQVLDVAQKLWEKRTPVPEKTLSGEREALALIMTKLGS